MNGNLPTFVRVSTLDGHSNQNAGFSPADMHAAFYQPKIVSILFDPCSIQQQTDFYVPLLTGRVLK